MIAFIPLQAGNSADSGPNGGTMRMRTHVRITSEHKYNRKVGPNRVNLICDRLELGSKLLVP